MDKNSLGIISFIRCLTATSCILFLCLLLSGCWNIAVTSVSTIYNRHHLQNSLSNHEIALEIQNNFTKNPVFKNSHISASCFNLQVLLVGQTQQKTLQKLAVNIAANTHSVQHVYNFITLEKPVSTKQSIKDSWITTCIKGRIIAIGHIDPDNIKVITENSAVYLMGTVSHEEAKEIIDIARYTPDVKRVVKIFQYIYYSKQ